MYNLGNLNRADTVVGIRNFRLDSPNEKYRIYMELCPFGDLWNVLDVYVENRKLNPPPGPAWLPEDFIWHAFISLATSGQLMETGNHNPRATSIAAWDQIIHRDYKLDNVFLSLPSGDKYSGYPMLKLGDFGLATMLPENDSSDPEDLDVPVGSAFCRAPEQIDHDWGKHSSKSNVWGVGNIIWSLIALENGYEGLDWEDEEELRGVALQPRLPMPPFNPEQRNQYSAKLLELTSQCLAVDQSERPTFRQLLRRIHRATEAHVSTQAPEERILDAPASHYRFAQFMTASKLKQNFQIGKALAGEKPPAGLGGVPKALPRSGGGGDGGDGGDDSSDDDSSGSDEEPGGAPGAELTPAPTGGPSAPGTSTGAAGTGGGGVGGAPPAADPPQEPADEDLPVDGKKTGKAKKAPKPPTRTQPTRKVKRTSETAKTSAKPSSNTGVRKRPKKNGEKVPTIDEDSEDSENDGGVAELQAKKAPRRNIKAPPAKTPAAKALAAKNPAPKRAAKRAAQREEEDDQSPPPKKPRVGGGKGGRKAK
ncbi:hypothetical protein LTR08_006271 [Meristemomyces frigidus]|nr:hypothetical protein LTR08_006271 [Meristemomyces frigidus]